MNTFDKKNQSELETSAGQNAQVDMLALFDKASIGNEFAKNELPKGPTRDIEMRRDAVNRDHWLSTSAKHKAAAEPAEVPAERFSRVRQFEERTMNVRGAVFWMVFAIIVLGGGLIYGFILQRWALNF